MTTRRPDPYAVLGVAASVSDAEIRSAYRRRIAALHPDRPTPEGESVLASMRRELGMPTLDVPQAIGLLKDAKAQLGSAERRRAYDERRRQAATGGAQLGEPPLSPKVQAFVRGLVVLGVAILTTALQDAARADEPDEEGGS